MGIPSYYRKLIQKYPGILLSSPPKTIDTLCFDFNCLIYRCIRAPGMPDASTTPTEEFETALLKEVRRTTKEVWDAASRPKKVFLAVDGVVPMAKIRQQRVRRFKSASLGKNSWDTNAITPGTHFMEKLTQELKSLVKECGKGWELSSVDESGEGEHKVMNWIRKGKHKGDILVYGLDADLILLSMLTGAEVNTSMYLFREKQEFGGQLIQTDGIQEYSTLNIQEFKKHIGLSTLEEVKAYATLMSLMGNDFLPHSLTHSLKEDGHECVLKALKYMKDSNTWIVEKNKVNISVLQGVVSEWGKEESQRFAHMIKKKQEQAGRGVGKGMDPSEGLPLQWNVEKKFLQSGKLLEDWRDIYWKSIHPQATEEIKKNICSDYVKGLQWILDYYLGMPVNQSWMFPSWIPPLWSDLKDISGVEEIYPEDPKILPAEQLAMVLPLESWGLIRGVYKTIPSSIPHMWPKAFAFFSLGRKWFWECEAMIPVLSVEKLRSALQPV